MPLQTSGEGYRVFSEPRFFECVLEAQVQQIELPVDKAHAIVAAADGTTYAMWKFDSASTAAASASVIIPDNPMYADTGRWIKLPTGGGGGGGGGLQSGVGSPEGVADAADGQFYFDTDGEALYANLATSGTTGWFIIVQF